MRVILLSCSVGTLLFLTGCATVIHGTREKVMVSSTPTAAQVMIKGVSVASTPGIIELKRKDTDIVLRFEKEGYESSEVILHRKYSGWIVGNLAIPMIGIFGGAIDFGMGAAYKLAPTEVYIDLQKQRMKEENSSREEIVVVTPDSSSLYIEKADSTQIQELAVYHGEGGKPIPTRSVQQGATPIAPSSKAGFSVDASDRDFYVVPYLGLSTLVGVIGIEFRYKHWGVDMGYLAGQIVNVDHSLSGGFRYYFDPNCNSWFIGLGGGMALDEPKQHENFCPGSSKDECDVGYVLDTYMGIMLGYRWKRSNALNLNVGIGPTKLKWKKIKDGDRGDYLPMFELAMGYSF